jgi:cobalt-zinc-cadmium resistance protein CzcA
MSTFVAMLGLFPAAVSRGIGSETQKPLAIVVIGGALALVILPRLLQPAWSRWPTAGTRRVRPPPTHSLAGQARALVRFLD